jgi:hypothetical protein
VSHYTFSHPCPVVANDNRRGKSGGQVRDEYREEYDPGRGGYGRAYDELSD